MSGSSCRRAPSWFDLTTSGRSSRPSGGTQALSVHCPHAVLHGRVVATAATEESGGYHDLLASYCAGDRSGDAPSRPLRGSALHCLKQRFLGGGMVRLSRQGTRLGRHGTGRHQRPTQMCAVQTITEPG